MRILILLLAAALAGALTLFAFAPYRLFWLMPLCLAALVELLQREPRRAFWLGYAWGLGAYVSNFRWIYDSLHDVAGLPAWIAAPLVLLLPAYLALYPGLASWLACRIDPRPGVRWLLAFPAAWELGEWLRGWVMTGFPWGAAGYSQITESPLAGYAPLGGIHLVNYLVALSAAALAMLARAGMRQRIGILIAAALAWGSGVWLRDIEWTTPAGKPIAVALAQGNIAQELKWSPENLENSLLTYYRQVAMTRADLMILPETALPLFLDDLPSGYLSMMRGEASRAGMALASGIPRRTDDGRGYLNSVVALSDPKMPYYAKDHLVPFGEFVPLPGLIGWIYQHMDMPLSGFTRGGADQPPLTLAGQKVAFNVCYEDSFGEELIGPASRAGMLANVSNLAWFGKSEAMSQHLQLSQARSLETGRYMLRATNNGMTAIIRPDGEISAVAAPFTAQVLTGFAQSRQGLTPYMRVGNLPVVLGCGALLLLALLLGWRRRGQH
ncbi:apolipoprotein N-acyltransferase [Chromobacterium violaceum]|uniref:apolipoprotein N-acyltransferase n=1 Tax=Chromobacterium violaceum TaxID=536 RepID=UPI0006545F1B|nr:apolipoprotein N-acyltransferase [Chromobacterium violaceum]KMN49980.1 acyltransferase [Chromobacterium violaceum]KMN87040.1 acyltransferase [Chromobacterium violaceum]KMN88782.1 acyltransferase [Chromobacterium violaceum]KMO03421.1 acyltransferase [Chromobacterium violaceum]MBA8733804.1 apolipoprotein N-acyltransferase [Chromobacterium violaceum]